MSSVARPRSMRRYTFAVLFLFSIIIFGKTFSHAQQSQPTPAATPQQNLLAKVEFVGLKRITQEEALRSSGLTLGSPVDVEAADQAAQRLLDSGLFKKLGYSLRTAKGQATVIFTVEEMAGARAPVVFDNFVWFSDREINEFLRKNITGYDGTASDAGAMTDNIIKALTNMLLLKGIKGKVEYTPSADASGRNPEHIFSVKEASLRVCSLKFTGTAAVKEETLLQNSAGIFSNEYSRQYVRAFAAGNLSTLYRERGHLRAAFGIPQARPTEAGEACIGVAVTVPVDEGIAYVWDGAEWTGNQALAAQELDRALAMTNKQLANALKIDKGLEAVRKAYSRKGYLSVSVSQTPSFDDAARSVRYQFQIDEGPQYQMGEVVINGLSEKDSNNLKTRWRTLPREPFDAEYPKEFMQKTVAEFLRDPSTDLRASGQKVTVDTSERRDREKLRVDVIIEFKPAK